MTVKFETSVVINRPVEEIFEFVPNFENEMQWQSGVRETEKNSEGPMGMEATYTQVGQFLGRRIEGSLEVTEYEPNRKWCLKQSQPFPGEGCTSFETVKGGTKITFAAEGEAGGLFKLADPLVARMNQRQTETDYAALKDILEAQG